MTINKETQEQFYDLSTTGRKETALEKAAHFNNLHQSRQYHSQGSSSNEMSMDIDYVSLIGHIRDQCRINIHSYFEKFTAATTNVKQLLCFPKFLANGYYTGAEPVLRALVGTDLSNAQIVVDFSETHGFFGRNPTPTDYIKFLTESEEDKSFTFAELFWLGELSYFLNCTTPAYREQVIDKFLNSENNALGQLYFKKKLPYLDNAIEGYGTLPAAITEQYAAIEALLNRY